MKPITLVVAVGLAALMTPSSAKEVSCNGGFVLLGGKICIKVFTEPKTWADASEACKKVDNYVSKPPSLANFNDCSLLSSLYDYIHYQLGLPYDLWIGGSDFLVEGEWMWEDGSPVPVGVPFWHPIQPDGGNVENALIFAHNGYFADGHHEKEYGYICQYEP